MTTGLSSLSTRWVSEGVHRHDGTHLHLGHHYPLDITASHRTALPSSLDLPTRFRYIPMASLRHFYVGVKPSNWLPVPTHIRFFR